MIKTDNVIRTDVLNIEMMTAIVHCIKPKHMSNDRFEHHKSGGCRRHGCNECIQFVIVVYAGFGAANCTFVRAFIFHSARKRQAILNLLSAALKDSSISKLYLLTNKKIYQHFTNNQIEKTQMLLQSKIFTEKRRFFLGRNRTTSVLLCNSRLLTVQINDSNATFHNERNIFTSGL
jgi:hypothetical protein